MRSALLAAAIVLSPTVAAWADEPAATTAVAAEAAKPAEKSEENDDKQGVPHIDVALLLDTSNSMDGLINQARTQLWQIVNEFEAVRRDGVRPVLRVALYEYGNQGLAAEGNYIRQVVPLTTNLDQISEQLFALTTNGGDEFCGAVIEKAVAELEWSTAPGSMRAIFIAGNEPFNQGPIDYKQACSAATAKNITVSTIHCGTADEGQSGMWADGAKLADGKYLVIDQDKIEPAIAAPQDEELTRLSSELNTTYLAYGHDEYRRMSLSRQVAQDGNAAGAAPAAAAARAATKSSGNYRNSEWDLVDALSEHKVELESIAKDQLPEELRDLTLEQLKAKVDEMATKRAELQKKIQELSEARNKYIVAERAKLAEKTDDSLESVVGQTVREQAVAEGFEFER